MAKPIRWTGKHMGQLKFSLDQLQRRVDTTVHRILEDVADEGVSTMQGVIETTPSSLVPGKIGRIDTGNMYDSVDKKFKGRTSVAIGWVSNKENYFVDQDKGTGSKDGNGYNNIKPMHALLGTRIAVVEELKARLNKEFKR